MQVEVGERKDRVTDALNATKAAIDEGIVAGGGAALLHASHSLTGIKEGMANLDQRVGVEIIAKAVQMPAKTILKNAGHEGAVVVGKLLESKDPNQGFDSSTAQYCNMVDAGALPPLLSVSQCCDMPVFVMQRRLAAFRVGVCSMVPGPLVAFERSPAAWHGAGIIDPLKVVRTALVDAASVSSLITTSECIVVEAPPDPAAPAAPPMGGMGGGMGGMGGGMY